jgi:hypothetical protein
MSMDYGCGDNSCVFGSPGGMATNGGCRCFEEMARTPEGRQARRNLQKGIYFMRQKLARHREAIRLLSEITEYQPLSDSDDGYIAVWCKAEAFLAVHFEEDKP